jgi:hypothetical protein
VLKSLRQTCNSGKAVNANFRQSVDARQVKKDGNTNANTAPIPKLVIATA